MRDNLGELVREAAAEPLDDPDFTAMAARGHRQRTTIRTVVGVMGAVVLLVAGVTLWPSAPASSPVISDVPTGVAEVVPVELPTGWHELRVGGAVLGLPEDWAVETYGEPANVCANADRPTAFVLQDGPAETTVACVALAQQALTLQAAPLSAVPPAWIEPQDGRTWRGITIDGVSVPGQQLVRNGSATVVAYRFPTVDLWLQFASPDVLTSEADAILATVMAAPGQVSASADGEVFDPGDVANELMGPLAVDGAFGPTMTVAADDSQDGMLVTAPGEFAETRWFMTEDRGCREVGRATFLEVATDGRLVTFAPADPRGAVLDSYPQQLAGAWFVHDGCEAGDPIIGGAATPATATPTDAKPQDPAEALAAARQAWAAAGIDDYVLTVDVQCFCQQTGPHRIVVEDGKIVAVTDLTAGQALAVTDDVRDGLTTVDDLHDRIAYYVGDAGCPASPEDVLDVRYDDDGIPRSLDADRACSADEEQQIAVSAVVSGDAFYQRVDVPISSGMVRPPGEVLDLTVNACNADEDVVVTESDAEVRLRVIAAQETLDDCADGVTVRLARPLGTRAVIDDTTGKAVPLGDG